MTHTSRTSVQAALPFCLSKYPLMASAVQICPYRVGICDRVLVFLLMSVAPSERMLAAGLRP